MNQYLSKPLTYIILIVFTIIIIIFISISSCTSPPCEHCQQYGKHYDRIVKKVDKLNDYEEELRDFSNSKLIEEFHKYISNYKSTNFNDSVIEVFLDASNGMYPIISSPETRSFLDYLTRTLPNNTNYILVSGGRNTGFKFDTTGGCDAAVIFNQNNYRNNGSPLDSVLSIITSSKKQAVFFTDGELAKEGKTFNIDNKKYSKKKSTIVDPFSDWAKDQFTDWLKKGNHLDFIVIPFESNRPCIDTMKLFLMFFTPKEIYRSGDSQIKSFIDKTKQDNLDNTYEHLHFSIDDFKITKYNPDNSKKQNEVGINTAFVDYFGGLYEYYYDDTLNYEHIHLYNDVDDFNSFVYDLIAGDYDSDIPKKEKSKLFFDLIFTNQYVTFDSVELGVRLMNINSDIDSYIKLLKVKKTDTVQFIEPGFLKKIIYCIDDEFDCPSQPIEFTYLFNNETLVNGVLKLDQSFLSNWSSTVGNKNEQNIAIRFLDPNNFNFIDYQDLQLLKIDILINKLYWGDVAEIKNILTWENRNFNPPLMDGIYESICFAMNENIKEIENTVIYTYYLTFED